ncbi:hypothetical protein U1Q18_017538 [Sarracenia purpurea var. burkii]
MRAVCSLACLFVLLPGLSLQLACSSLSESRCSACCSNQFRINAHFWLLLFWLLLGYLQLWICVWMLYEVVLEVFFSGFLELASQVFGSNLFWCPPGLLRLV